MGNFSRDSFDRLKHYVSVRLQQGVPIVDADWNELQDIRKFELEAFLKWFVGNGVPYGNDGFAIASSGNDFTIADGYCLVDGWGTVNDYAAQNGAALLRYIAQPLYQNAALADAWGVAVLPALPPASVRDDTVYLDVWEREVGSGEDDEIVDPVIGIETCMRTKREWVVRVAVGAAAPPAPSAGHAYYPLATVHWTSAGIDRITDRRRTGINVSSLNEAQQIVADAFGAGYTLDGDGLPNLEVSLRDAINAILAGGLPGTAAAQITFDSAYDEKYDSNQEAFLDSQGDVWVFWEADLGDDEGEGVEIYCRRYESLTGNWTPEHRLTTHIAGDYFPKAFEDSAKTIWVFWQSYRDSFAAQIWCVRYDPISKDWGSKTKVTSDPSGTWEDETSVVERFGDIWLFWTSWRTGHDIWYKVWSHDNGTWATEARLPTVANENHHPAAIVDSSDQIWVFWDTNGDIMWQSYDGTTWTPDNNLTTGTESDSLPVAVEDSSGDIWVFWLRSSEIWYQRYHRPSGLWGSPIQVTSNALSANYGGNFSVVAGAHGAVWVFWTSPSWDIFYKHYTAEVGWGPAIQVAADPGYHFWDPVACIDQEERIWVFYSGQPPFPSVADIWYRRFISRI